MHNLGQTRSSQQPNHLLLTADTFVRTPLPGMKGCTAIVHASPAIGAKFAQYTAEFEAGGELGNTAAQRFVFVIEGGAQAGNQMASKANWAYAGMLTCPKDRNTAFRQQRPSRVDRD